MTVSVSPNNNVLVLSQLRLLGDTKPVIGADTSISLAASELVADGKGAEVDVDPPLSGTMNPGDVMKLWLEGESTFLHSETIVDPNAITRLRIPKGRLHPDRINRIFYDISRGSGNIGTSTPPLTVLFNMIRPGLKDIRPDIDGHSELILLLPPEIANGVAPGFVSATVCVKYPYCRAHDTITLKCNGEIMTYKVRDNEAPPPPDPGSATPTTICFIVDRAFLEKAVRLDNTLAFSYTVTDQIGNTPDTDAVWSAAVIVEEDLADNRLPAAILREILNDPGDDPGTIDLIKLGDKPLLVIVLTANDKFEPGDTINVTYMARVPGQPDVVVTISGTVTADQFGQKDPCILQVPNDKVPAGATVTVSYVLLRGATPIGNSRTATAQVIGEVAPDLKPPSVQQANGDSLPPLAAQTRLTVIVPQGNLLLTDLLSVIWTAADDTHEEGSHTTPPRPISESGLAIELDPKLIPFSFGQAVKVSYSVTRGGAPAQPSQPFPLNVQSLPSNVLVPPLLKDAANNGEGPELNLANLTATSKVRASTFPFIALGQYVWLHFQGTLANGNPYDRYQWQAPNGQTNDSWITNSFYEETTLYNELRGLKDGTPLTMEFKVAFGKNQDIAKAVSFPVRTYTVVNEIIVEDFETQMHWYIGPGEKKEIPTMDIEVLDYAAQAGINTIIKPIPNLEGKVLNMGSTNGVRQRTSLTLKRPCNEVSFGYGYVNVPEHTVDFYGVNGHLGQQNLIFTTVDESHEITFTARGITRMEFSFRTPDIVSFDNFSFHYGSDIKNDLKGI